MTASTWASTKFADKPLGGRHGPKLYEDKTRNTAPRRLVGIALATAVLSGCSTLIAYRPHATSEYQTLKYVQGVGTLAVKNDDHEIFIYSTFKTQGSTQPTFTIGYANNSAGAVDFSADNVKAYFRGVPVPIYTYTDKVDEIQTDKRSKQITLAILGGLAAGAAAYGASHQTYKSNYSGSIWTRRGSLGYAGSNTLRVYDPMSGILAGAAVGGATGLGVRQLEYNAQTQEQAANSILQANTVEPQRMVTGDLILKNCCDPDPRPDDVIRFEVMVNNRVSEFEFVRVSANSPVVAAPTMARAYQTPPAVVPVSPTSPVVAAPTMALARQTSTQITPIPDPARPALPPPMPVARPVAAVPSLSGEYVSQAERLTRTFSCGAPPKFVAKGPDFETYSVACYRGDPMMLRCDGASCREMK